jgi:hypothetical protein
LIGNVDWTGQISKVGKGASRRTKGRVGGPEGGGADDYNRYAILTGNVGAIVYGAIVAGLCWVDWRVALIVALCCARRLTISK